jgi:hypothetical protein
MTLKFNVLEYSIGTNSNSFLKTNRAQKSLNSVNSFIILLAITDLSFHMEINKDKLKFNSLINKSVIGKRPFLNKNDLMIKSKKSIL